MGPTHPCYGEGPGRSPEPAVLTPVSGGEAAEGREQKASATRDALGSAPQTEPRSGADTLVLSPGAEPVPGYRLIERLGRGGYGEVWKATGPGDFQVALKFVALAGQTGPVELRSLQLIKNIRHPHLLTIFGSWQIGGYLALAMELAECTLQDRLTEALGRGAVGLPGPELVQALMDAARGLDYLNEPRHPSADGGEPVGIQHRDIKPHNLLLVGGCVKVADFGLARILRGTHTGHTGSLTPSFAAPEFFRNETSRHSDQYSLAVTYCVLRGGRLPFSGSIEQIIAGHLMREPDLSMLPEAERPPVARALDKDPSRRWPSCRAFVEELRRAVTAAGPGPEAVTTLPHPSLAVSPSPAPTTDPATTRPPAGRSSVRLFGKVLALSAMGAGLVLLAYAVHVGGISVSLLSQPRVVVRKTVIPSALPPAPAPAPVSPPAPTPAPTSAPEPAPFIPGELRHFKDPEGPASCLALSADGRRGIAGGADGRIRLWDLQSGDQRLLMDMPSGRVAAVAILPNPQAVTAGVLNPFLSSDRPLWIWDLDAGTRLRGIEGPGSVVTVMAVSSDGHRVIAGGADGSLWLGAIDGSAAGRTIRSGSGSITCLAISPSGARALSGGGDGSVILWDLDRGEILQHLAGHRSGVLAVAFVSGGERAASASGPAPFRDEPPTLRIWDLSAASERSRHDLPANTTCVALAADSNVLGLLGTEDGSAWMIDAGSSGKPVRLGGHAGRVSCAVLSPDGRIGLSTGKDHSLRLWRLKP